MGAAIRSKGTALSNASRSNSVLVAPAGIQNGDILVAFLDVGNAASPAVTPPGSFVEVSGYPIVRSRTDPWYVNTHCYVKVASGESGNYTFTHTTAYTQGMIYCISGADTANPVSPTPTKASHDYTSMDNPFTITAPGITTPRDGSVVIFVAGTWDFMNTDPPTGSTPTFSEDLDDAVFFLASGVKSTAGATGDKSVNISMSTDVWGAGLVCIQAAGGPSAALTGTITGSITEADIVAGGKTIILTLTGDTWVAS